MQKVRSYFFWARTAYKTTFYKFPSRYYYTIAYAYYLALEEGSP